MNLYFKIFTVLMVINLFFYLPLKAQETVVTAVTDGDTIKVSSESKYTIIRLKGIDAPELNQPFGEKSKQVLISKIMGKKVTIEGTEIDRYGRLLSDIKIGNRSICRELVQEGYAWHYKQYSNNSQLDAAEKSAIKNRRGLWSSNNPVPPWEFRRQKRNELNSERSIIDHIKKFINLHFLDS
jgi:endonuclease YncB( thermonuclease family)